jgi:hypothetical protein
MPFYRASVADLASVAGGHVEVRIDLSSLLHPGPVEAHLLSKNPALARVAFRLMKLDALVGTLPEEPAAGLLRRALTELLSWQWVGEAEDESEMILPPTILTLTKDRQLEFEVDDASPAMDGRGPSTIPGTGSTDCRETPGIKRTRFAVLHSRRPPRGTLRRLLEAADAVPATNSSDPFAGRLVIDLETNSVTLDGKTYPNLDPSAARALDALRRAGGKPTKTAKVRARLDGCNHDTTFRRWLGQLPEPLRKCRKWKTGLGIWLELPPRC